MTNEFDIDEFEWDEWRRREREHRAARTTRTSTIMLRGSMLMSGRLVHYAVTSDGWFCVRDDLGSLGWIPRRRLTASQRRAVQRRVAALHHEASLV